MARILAALHLRCYDHQARADRLKRADELQEVARVLRGKAMVEADEDAQQFMRRWGRPGGRH